MALSYQNVNITVGGASIFATNGSTSFQVPLEAVRALGNPKAIANIVNGPAQGTLNISYIVTTSDPIGTIFNNIINSPTTYNGTVVNIGGLSYTAYLTSHSLNGEANSIINGSASFTVFGPGGGTFSTSSAGNNQTENIGHGSATNLSITNAVGFDYSANVEWQPLYVLGTSTVNSVIFSSASQTLTLRGNNIGRYITQCPNKENFSFNIGAICVGSSLTTVTITEGKLQSSESSVQAGGFVESNYVLTRNY
jgi:hypothetical protein